jgi:ribosomal protein S18 acetylase RimI-like enzyme
MEIRSAQKEDCKQIAVIHKKIFYDHFLGKLSVRLIKKFYECFVSEQLIFLVSVHKNNVLGFVLGGNTYELQKIRKIFIRKNLFGLLVCLAFTPNTYPFVLSRFKKKDTQNTTISIDPFRLLSIGVEQKRSGIGSALMKHFEDNALQIPVSSYGLSVYKTNEKAISFYQKNDLKIEAETEDSLYFHKKLI